MRSHGGQCRIVILAPKSWYSRRTQLAVQLGFLQAPAHRQDLCRRHHFLQVSRRKVKLYIRNSAFRSRADGLAQAAGSGYVGRDQMLQPGSGSVCPLAAKDSGLLNIT